ncbi:hypothetical protein U5A82_03785 [Sphingobium sp. CR2-8]|nr:hypothetical protein [Sphingobium sp. CR2-8]MEC3909622.1 hypothetical protein [Sphingobium sp. CR2-8]
MGRITKTDVEQWDPDLRRMISADGLHAITRGYLTCWRIAQRPQRIMAP